MYDKMNVDVEFGKFSRICDREKTHRNYCVHGRIKAREEYLDDISVEAFLLLVKGVSGYGMGLFNDSWHF
jgi:hypothetical protein